MSVCLFTNIVMFMQGRPYKNMKYFREKQINTLNNHVQRLSQHIFFLLIMIIGNS